MKEVQGRAGRFPRQGSDLHVSAWDCTKVQRFPAACRLDWVQAVQYNVPLLRSIRLLYLAITGQRSSKYHARFAFGISTPDLSLSATDLRSLDHSSSLPPYHQYLAARSACHRLKPAILVPRPARAAIHPWLNLFGCCPPACSAITEMLDVSTKG